MNKFFFFIIILLKIEVLSLAQNAVLTGKIIDKSTGEELIGATVVIVGTYNGGASDFDGNYLIEKIKPNIYDVKCSFISYETKIIKNIKIKSNETNILNFSLNPVSIKLDEVIIRAKAMRNSEISILMMQKKTFNIIDGISSQQISKTGDNNAASALKRITGISVGQGKYVYVRGLGDRYNKSALNGAEIPSLDPERNSVQMDLFPSNIIDNIIVKKTFTPDLPGNFSGGYINVVTKDFPEKFTLKFSSSLGYNTNSSLNKNFLTCEGEKLGFLKFDNVLHDIPSIANNDIPELYVDNDRLDSITRSFNNNWALKKKYSFLNNSYSLSFGNQIKFLGKPLGYIAGFNYRKKYSYYNDGVESRYRLIGSNSNNLNNESYYNDTKGKTGILWGLLLNISYKMSDNNDIGFNYIKNQDINSSARYMIGEVASDGTGRFRETRSLKSVKRTFNSLQLKGKHYLENFAYLKINWICSYTLSSQLEPDLRFFTNSYYPDKIGEKAYSINTSEYSDPTRYYRNMNEYNFNYKIDFNLPFNYFGNKSDLKFGALYIYKNRNFDEKKFSFTSQQPEMYSGNINNYFVDNNIGKAGINTVTGLYGIYVQNSVDEDKTNSYNANQSVISTYIMVNIPLSNKLNIIAGARLETTDINCESKNPSKKKGNIDNKKDLLPALNINYKINKKSNLRAAITRTIARPSFRELAPYASFNFQGDYVNVGNADLKRTVINNIDLRWECFLKPSEIIAISAFYKNFINPIERTFNPEAGNDELTWRNVDNANLLGIEAEFRKKLDFIDALKNYRIGANITFVKSYVNLDQKELNVIHATEPDYPETRVMYGQSPYVVNAILSYVNDTLNLKANISYNITGKRLISVILGGTPNVYEEPYGSLNFNVSKNIGKNCMLKLSADNLLNKKLKKSYTRWNENSTWKNNKYLFSSYNKGRTYSLKFIYTLN